MLGRIPACLNTSLSNRERTGMRHYVAIGFAVLTLFAARPASVMAQDSVLAELYGQGVHAYFAGQHQDAHEYLTTAIDQGTRDPRAFYFRGLAYTAMGRPQEAKADFQKGAGLETRGADRVYPVSYSLQRVQGKTRVEIERQRQLARITSRTRSRTASHARYEQLQRSEQQVLRDSSRAAPTQAKELVGTPPMSDDTDPFGNGTTAAAPEPAPEPAVEPAAEPDLFGDGDAGDAMPADPTPEDEATDPFADDTPAEDPKPAEDPEPESDPFADPFADPFG